MNSFEERKGTIIFPKFKMTYEKELIETLTLLGMERLLIHVWLTLQE